MSRMEACFNELAKTKQVALISYITAGDPKPELTVDLMHTLVEGGTNIIELGVPFSDPMADGPVIQAACERALLHHTSLQNVLEMVREFRKKNSHTPVVIMGYQNPIEVMSVSEFAKAANHSQVDGVLTVDLPIEQGKQAIKIYQENNLDPIFLIAPTTSNERIKNICDYSSGFVYYVSLKGVTGAANLDVAEVQKKVNLIKQYSNVPVGVGFGIKDAKSAKSIANIADAVVVGSAIIQIIEANQSEHEKMFAGVKSLLLSMRAAMDDRDTASGIKQEVA